MRTRHVYLALVALSISGIQPLKAGPKGGELPAPGGILQEISTWEWGTPAIDSAHEQKSAILSPTNPKETLPGQVGAKLIIPNELPLNRAYQARLRGVLKQGGAPLPVDDIEGPWQAFDPREEEVGVTLDWSPLGLSQGDAGRLTLTLIAEVALANTGGEEIIVKSEPFEVGTRLEIAAAMGSLLPNEGGTVEVMDAQSPLDGAQVKVPMGALEGSEPLKVALVPARRLPAHSGYRAWRSQPLELRIEGTGTLSKALDLTIPLLPGGSGEAQGISHWDPEKGIYVFTPGHPDAADTMRVSTTVTGYWGVPLAKGGDYDFTLDIRIPSGEALPQALCDGEPCPDSHSTLRASIGDLDRQSSEPYGLLSQLLIEGTSSPAPLGSGDPSQDGPSKAGLCLEGSWGSTKLLPGGEVFESTGALASLPSSGIRACGDDSLNMQNPSSLPITRAFIPGKAEFVSWVVPNAGQVYSGPPSSSCSDSTIDALEAYLSLDNILDGELAEIEDSGGGQQQVTVYPLIFDCLWLHLDPTINDAAASFNDHDRPTTIAATLPGSLDESGLADLKSETSATLFYQLASSSEAPLSEETITTTLVTACEGGTTSDIEITSLPAPSALSSDDGKTHLTYAAPPHLSDAEEAPIGVFVLKISQAADASAQACAPIQWAPDKDGDGYSPLALRPEERDCDDTEAAINPGAVEVCDYIDNDCDDVLDEGVSEDIFADGDDDGFGLTLEDGSQLKGCIDDLPEGFAAVDGDCNDNREDVFPGADEICDGIDQNCDGTIDEDLTSTFYADNDSDNFGDASDSIEACTAPGDGSYVADDSDCDDTLSTTFPGAPDLCNDIDDDCDSLVDEAADTPLFRDVDRDGFGAGDSEMRCAESGWVSLGGDCNDEDKTINPGAPILPAIPKNGGLGRYFGCETIPPYTLIDTNQDGRVDAASITPGRSIQAAIDAIPTLEAYLERQGIDDSYDVPNSLKLAAGHFEERIIIDGLSLYIEGSQGWDDKWSTLNAGGDACYEEAERCSALAVIGGARVSLRGLNLEDGRGSSLRALTGGVSQVSAVYGGAIAVVDSAMIIEECRLSDNQAELGGAIAVIGATSDVRIGNSDILNNWMHGTDGFPFTGAIFLEDGAAQVFNNTIQGNFHGSGGPSGFGAGVTSVDGDLMVLSNRILDNQARYGAGVMAVSYGAGSLSLHHNHIEGNIAAVSGGGVDVMHLAAGSTGEWSIKGNVILDNLAIEGVGGGILIEGEDVTISDTLIAENTASVTGGGLAYLGDDALIVEQSLFYANDLSEISTQRGADVSAPEDGSINLRGSILLPRWDNSLPWDGISYDQSAIYGAEDDALPFCQSELGIGQLMAPADATSPFAQHQAGLSTKASDFHLLPDSTLHYQCISSPGEGGSGTQFDSLYLDTDDLGLYGGGGQFANPGEIIPDCAQDLPVAYWDGADITLDGDLSSIDQIPAGFDGPVDGIMVYLEAGQSLKVNLQDAGFPFEASLVTNIDGVCAEAVQEAPQSMEPGEFTYFHPLYTGYHLLRIRSTNHGDGGPYRIDLSL